MSRRDNFLSPSTYDNDASSIRSDQDSDSDDDERQLRARNSRELRAHDRIVLLEEEETDDLVVNARRERSRSNRRGSNLALPLKNLFSRKGREGSRSRSPNASRGASRAVADDGDTEEIEMEKRQRRRRRRKEKRDQLLEKAHNGEDGELMYEMEEGGMKEGSQSGSSDGREDSDEVDRRRLSDVGEKHTRRRRTFLRWLLIHSIIATAFAILLLIAWKLSVQQRAKAAETPLLSNGTALFAPTTIIISLDGFRADFLQRGITPRLNAFIKEGVSPPYMTPSFPSVTFPNHYTLATGLYPESHGVVGNSFWDPDLKAGFYYTDPARSMDPKWWSGEPFWVTAEEQGIRTAVHMWPGSEAHIAGVEPTFLDEYNGKEVLDNKVARIMELLDKPGLENAGAMMMHRRPQLIAAYVPNVDADGHKYGPNSTEILTTIGQVDKMMDDVFLGLERRNLTSIVNVIVVSDHGMATTDVDRLIQMNNLLDLNLIEHIDGWPLVGLRPKNTANLQAIYDGLTEKAKSNHNFDVYLRDVNMPGRYHFANNQRIAPLWIVPKTGWAIVTKEEFDIEKSKANGLVYHPRGLHGYDHEHPLMRAIFIARGPAFPHQPNSRLEPFQNTEVYNILCDSVGMKPMANNGTLRLPLKPVGLHDEESKPEIPVDPVASYTITSASAAVSTLTMSSIPSSLPTPSVGVDMPEVPSPTPSSMPDGDQGGEKEPQGWWDWLTDKVDTFWGKITGHADGDDDRESK